MIYIVSYMCTIVGVYSCAVDANQCVRALRRVGCIAYKSGKSLRGTGDDHAHERSRDAGGAKVSRGHARAIRIEGKFVYGAPTGVMKAMLRNGNTVRAEYSDAKSKKFNQALQPYHGKMALPWTK